MGKMAMTFDDKLPAFQKYLLEKKLVPAKNVPFYAHWVSRFLDYARRNEFSALECLQKLPVVFSVEEVKRLLACMNGRDLLISGLLYGAGLRLMELARLRVKDIDMDLNTLTARSGKGDKDRTTILPATVKDELKNHLFEVKSLHERDLSRGYGKVHLPDALRWNIMGAPLQI